MPSCWPGRRPTPAAPTPWSTASRRARRLSCARACRPPPVATTRPRSPASFIQWVVEDDFAAGRPDWARVGVELVDSVQPYEEAKIRILNATHSCIAWAGTLVGLGFIHEGTHDAAIRKMAFDYVSDDVIPA